jgi:hypothetical protein
MIRVLYWNIKQFTQGKIADAVDLRSEFRANYIVRKIFTVNIPDIFIIVEVMGNRTPRGNEGKLNNGSGGQGAYTLLEKIKDVRKNKRDRDGNLLESWQLVPPICTGWGGYEESVAVYYNARRLQFIGPFVWTQEIEADPLSGQARPCDQYRNDAHTYANQWTTTLPHREIPNAFGCVTQGLIELLKLMLERPQMVISMWFWVILMSIRLMRLPYNRKLLEKMPI